MRQKTPVKESRATLKASKSFKLGAAREASLRPKPTSVSLSHTQTDLVGNRRN